MVLLVGVLNLLLLHFVVHTCKNTQIVESLKPVRVWNVRTIHLKPLTEPKRAWWENSWIIKYIFEFLAHNNASILFLGCKSWLFWGEKMEVRKTWTFIVCFCINIYHINKISHAPKLSEHFGCIWAWRLKTLKQSEFVSPNDSQYPALKPCKYLRDSQTRPLFVISYQ